MRLKPKNTSLLLIKIKDAMYRYKTQRHKINGRIILTNGKGKWKKAYNVKKYKI